tara:strand:- start:120 stop:1013 length:894 start_codon:yes stop_codon:yes gene_type:complete
MFNLFKKKKKWIRFYSIQPGVEALQPWIPAGKLKRKWKTDALKKYYSKDSTCPVMKVKRLWENKQAVLNGFTGEENHEDLTGLYQHAVTCPALSTLFETGYVMVAPADFVIKQNGDGKDFAWVSQVMFNEDNPTYVKGHIAYQTEGMRELVNPHAPVNETVVKLELPWRIQAHDDIVFLQIPIPYWDEKRFSIPTGIVDPRYSFEVNLQLFWHSIEEGEYLVKAGTPLAQWIPIERKYLNNKEYDVIIETANEEDLKNNKIMEFNRSMHFTETTTLANRIKTQEKILSLNKNKERFE